MDTATSEGYENAVGSLLHVVVSGYGPEIAFLLSGLEVPRPGNLACFNSKYAEYTVHSMQH